MSNSYDDGWVPRTRLGRKVQDGDIDSMSQALESGLPLKEAEVVDQLLPGLDD
jgi:small subunit ribosomal protein S5